MVYIWDMIDKVNNIIIKKYISSCGETNDFNRERIEYTSNMSVVASHGDTFERELARNKDSAVVDYIHNIQMYYSSSKNSTTLADSYIYTAMQYYR